MWLSGRPGYHLTGRWGYPCPGLGLGGHKIGLRILLPASLTVLLGEGEQVLILGAGVETLISGVEKLTSGGERLISEVSQLAWVGLLVFEGG